MTSNSHSDFLERIKAIHQELGIGEQYAKSCGLTIQAESENLVDTELDVFGRQPQLDARAYESWLKMKHVATKADITLQIISAYRSVTYQQNIFENKIAKGQSLENILEVNAAPGFSEHHTGLAIDIGCEGFEYLSESFDKSPAFAWLMVNAEQFKFSLSFPKDNEFGLLYEPWHWLYCP
jgi:zinc D-Ala-D-Ala carboxypeptidase